MKKTIKRFWGVGLIVILLSSLLVVPAPVSGGNYTFSADTTQPTTTNRLVGAAGLQVTDIDQTADGSTIYVSGKSGAAETATGAVTGTAFAAGDGNPETFTVTYIDQDGFTANAGSISFADGAIIGTTNATALAAGDTGILDITNIAVAVSDAAAGNFTITSDTTGTVLGSFDVATATFTDGSAITSSGKLLYQSTNGGTTWTPCTASGTTAATTFDLVAVAPDDANIVVVIDKNPTPNAAYLSTNGGRSFSALSALTAGTVANDLAISPQSGSSRYIAVGGNTAGAGRVWVWNYGSTVPSWGDIVTSAGLTGPNAWTPLTPTIEDVEAIAFSTSFVSDQAIMVVTEDTNVSADLRVGSFNIKKWDALVDASFPRNLETSGTLTVARADITLDPNFYLGDEATQIGFIGAQITTAAAAQAGGVYRIGPPLTQIYGSDTANVAVGSVAWDGTNLVAAPYVATQPAAGTVISIKRSSNPLATAGISFLTSSTAKTPGTGFEPKVIWNGGNVLCVSRGTNAGITSSSDQGKSFNGIALMNTNLNTINDVYVSADGSVIYMTATEGVDTNVWRYMDAKWQRVMIIANSTGNWLVRAAASDPNAVVLGLKTGSNMYLATDAGEYKWTARSSTTTIQDFAVESKDIIHVAGTSAYVYKSSNGAFTWGPPSNTNISQYAGGNLYSLTLLDDGTMLVGGTAGGVAYNDGSGWTSINPPLAAGGNVLVTATGTATGETIFAASSAAGLSGKWKIGTNEPVNGWTDGNTLASGATGMAYINGILYILDDTADALYRYLSPTIGMAFPFYESLSDGTYTYATTAINALKASTGSTTLWAIYVGTPDSLYSWTEYLATKADAPAQIFPTDGYMLQVNSLTGAPNNFVFQWSSPARISTTQAYGYDVYVYLDSAGKVRVGNATISATTSSTISKESTLGGTFTPIPGTTYYWKVRVHAADPVQSQYSDMRTFTVQPLAASVPSISSPANGATIKNQSPAFSWTPVTSCTKYEFQLSTTPTFGTTVLTDTPASAGTLVPVTIKLEKGKQYFWRVRALEPVQGDWSTVGNFLIAVDEPVPSPTPVVTVTQIPAPTISIPAPSPAPTYTLETPAAEEIAPTYIWAIIIIGAILVIAVIVLIVRTRRSV